MNYKRVLKRAISLSIKIIFLVILDVHISMAHDRPTPELNSHQLYNNADLVFIGSTFMTDDSSFHVVIIQSFKGTIADTLIGFTRESSFIPSLGDISLFYAKDLGNNRFYISDFSGSRSYSRPWGLSNYGRQLVPPPEVYNDEGLKFISRYINKFFYTSGLEFDIIRLQVASLTNQNQEEMKTIRNEIGELKNYVFILFGINSILIVTLILLFIKFKK